MKSEKRKKKSENKKDNKLKKSDENSKIKELEGQVKENLEGWQRAKADQINYRKKTEEQKTELIKYCNEELILKFLPVVDAFDLALEHIPKDLKGNDWAVGVVAIEDILLNVLKENGIEEIETGKQKFNPEFHEAIESIKNKDFKTGEIVEEVARGFKLNGRVIRAAKVRVAE